MTAASLGLAALGLLLLPGVRFAPQALPGGAQQFVLVAADLNADGAVDLLATNPPADAISIWLGDGKGGFAARPPLHTARFPRGLAVADVDGDGHLDLIVGANLADSVAIHRGSGDGSFGPAAQLPVGSHPFRLAAADLNRDGAVDVAVALEGAAQVAVLLNDRHGGFAPAAHVAVGASPSAVAAGDVDGDGHVDLAVACWRGNQIAVLRGDGRGGFRAAAPVPARGYGLYDVALADLDADGALDLVFPDIKEQALEVRYNDGHGGLARAGGAAAGVGVRGVAIADLNGDGRLDLAGSNTGDDTLSVALATAGGGFQAPQTIAVGRMPRTVVAADFDRDGRPDLAAANMSSNDVTLLLNRGATTFSGGPTPTPVITPPAFDAARLTQPAGLALDGSGHLYVADQGRHRIARLTLASGALETVAGIGVAGFGGDGEQAVRARLNGPTGVAVDAAGALYIADQGNHRIRRVDPNGVITTVAGTGAAGYAGDGGAARAATLNSPYAVAIDADGRLLIADFGNLRVRRVAADGSIATILGTGTPGSGGDGGPGTQAQIGAVTGLAPLPSGGLLVADPFGGRVRRLDRDGIVTTLAGGGSASGDGGPASGAVLRLPGGLAVDAAGRVYVAEQGAGRVRVVAADGTIGTLAGGLAAPVGLARAADGALYVSERGGDAIRRIGAGGAVDPLVASPP
ncbi:MAG: FG-GAP-like repeat-containing protein [Deltaproteobacteria bacterium]|nr:FG-GAP-like repeat-containing protein [Deltaproteobacteria bacterium]